MPNLVIDWLRPNKRLHLTPLSRPQDRGFFDTPISDTMFMRSCTSAGEARVVGLRSITHLTYLILI
jgi:hypothetical protein